MKKKYSLKLRHSFICMILIFESAAAQQGQWTWVHGDNISGTNGNYGTMGVPSPLNEPAATYEANEWKDLQGNFWFFGGGAGGSVHSDMWKYDPVTNEWTWISGPGAATVYATGRYNIQTVPSPNNYPPAKGYCAATWTDKNGDLWMFGGRMNAGIGLGNDLWRYNIATNIWTWMKGDSTNNPTGVYGTLGVPSPANKPGCRQETNASWVDSSGNLWFYGGLNGSTYSDLWKYDVATNEWTWMQGSSGVNVPPFYGTKGVAAPANTPGGRWVYCKWKDVNGDFWLFGGEISGGFKNDLWKYTLSNNQWTWMSGSSLTGNAGLYISQCTADTLRYPAQRWENRACWTDACHNFWLIDGGLNGSPKNDLWTYNPMTNEWKWVSGDSTINTAAVYGTLNVAAPGNHPAARHGSVGWADNNGRFFVFGGTPNYGSWYNDLFMYVVDSTCASSCVVQNLPVAHFTSSDTAFCTETGECIDFYDHSTGNPISWQWSFPGAAPDTSTMQNPTGICYFNPGTYAVTLIISNGVAYDTLEVSPHIIFATNTPQPTVTVTGSDTLTSSHASVYQWYYNGFPIAGATDSSYVAMQSGTYAVRITDSLGCSATSSGIPITILFAGLFDNETTIKIFPNPANDELNFSFPPVSFRKGDDDQALIIDIIGREVGKINLDSSRNSYSISTKNLCNAVYYLQLHLGGQTLNMRFIVVHK